MESLETAFSATQKSGQIVSESKQTYSTKLLQQNQMKFQERLAKVKKDTALQNQNFTHVKFSESNRPFY